MSRCGHFSRLATSVPSSRKEEMQRGMEYAAFGRRSISVSGRVASRAHFTGTFPIDLDSSVLGEGAVLNQKAQGEYAFACFLFIGMMGNADGRVFQRNSISASDAQSCWTGSCREYGAGGSVTAGE